MTLEASKHFLSIFILPCSLGVPGPFLITIVNRSLHHSAAVYVRGDRSPYKKGLGSFKMCMSGLGRGAFHIRS